MVRGIRGKVKGFSKASRRNLLDTTQQVQRDKLPLFVTLTYPNEFPQDAKVWKRHLDSFAKALRRIGKGRIGAIWKLEPQQRGAPHFHLLVWGVKHLHRFRQWLRLTWYRIAHDGDKHLGSAATQAVPVRSHRGVAYYAAKYMGKAIDGNGWDNPGRFWGKLNPEAIPWGENITADIPAWFAHRLKRWLRKATGWRYISHQGQTFYVGSPETWFLRLDEQMALSLGDICLFARGL